MGTAGLASLLFGASLSRIAERMPDCVELLESGGGVLLIGGLALIGLYLPFV